MNTAEMMAELKQYEGFQWRTFLDDLFPALLIFYRPTKPQARKGKVIGYFPKDGKTLAGGLIAKRAKPSSRQAEQNNQSVMTVIAMSPDDCGTIFRATRHRGFSKLVSLVYATPEEIEIAKKSWRYVLRKYKTFRGLYRIRGYENPAFQEICERLHHAYPSLASNQTTNIQATLNL